MVHSFGGQSPSIHPAAYIAENATIIGQVTLKAHANIWYGAVLRGDTSAIHIGENSNIQDNAVCHCDHGMPLCVGKNVTVGHGAILHSCTVGDGSLIGMGAILLNGCTVGAGCMVAAGALVTQNTAIPDGHLALGSPAKVVRPLSPEELASNLVSADHYRAAAEQQLPAAGETVL